MSGANAKEWLSVETTRLPTPFTLPQGLTPFGLSHGPSPFPGETLSLKGDGGSSQTPIEKAARLGRKYRNQTVWQGLPSGLKVQATGTGDRRGTPWKAQRDREGVAHLTHR